MSAKFLQVFTDDNSELQKQIGCMTGIFQIFERQQILSGRISGHKQKRVPSSRALPANSSLGSEYGSASPQIVLEKNPSLQENQRISMESSRTSFSSSSCSSFSSLEFNKSTSQEPLFIDRSIFPDKSSKSSPRLKMPSVDGRPPRHELHGDPPNASLLTARRSLDFREIVKDSINGDSRGLSVKTAPRQEHNNREFSRRDSPRPLQVSNFPDGSYVRGLSGQSRSDVDLDESLHVLVKLKDAPRKFSDMESPRTSFESKLSSFYPDSKEAPRFSLDGREASRQSLDSRENSKFASNLSELPRLSLDSREGSLRNSIFEPKSNPASKDSNRCSTGVVAKLMGLEGLPSLNAIPDTICRGKDFDDPNDKRLKPLELFQDEREYWLSSPMRSMKDPDYKLKPISNPRVETETAHWRKQERRSGMEAKFMHQQKQESVYSEIEKRLKELEFRQSSKDLRALKQILDAMHEKGLLETKKGEQESTRENQSLKPFGAQSQRTVPFPVLPKGSDNSGVFGSPIVIMKPAKSVKRSGLPSSSVVSMESLPVIQKLQACAMIDEKRISTNHRVAKARTFNASLKELSDKKTARVEEKGSLKVQPRIVQVSSKSQKPLRENSGSSVKTSSSLSPRMQQKKLEERSRPPLPTSDSSKPRRPSASKKPLEAVSPRSKLRQKPRQVQDSAEQLSECGARRNFCYQGEEISQKSDNNISVSSEVDIEVTSADRSSINSALQQGSRSPSSRAARIAAASVKKSKKPSSSLSGEASSMELLSAGTEQPSPISVLDASFCQDGLLQSPLRKSFKAIKDDQKRQTPEDSWTPLRSFDSPTNKSSSEINKKKLRSIENLLQKLSELSSPSDRNSTTDHIASLCETQHPDDRYVSEILLASGLLLKDLSAGPPAPAPIQLHPSGQPINPDLFLVLEQTNTNENAPRSKADQEKLHRKLVFDVVNEVLIQKLELTSSFCHPQYLTLPRKLAARYPSGQQLLKELCVEIERLQYKTARDEASNAEPKMCDEEVLRPSEGWMSFNKEVPVVVLEIERLVFKDLIDEVVSGEAVLVSLLKSSRERGKLTVK